MNDELIEDLRVNADAHLLDADLSVMTKAADALESQAQIIKRYETTAENCDLLRSELAAPSPSREGE